MGNSRVEIFVGFFLVIGFLRWLAGVATRRGAMVDRDEDLHIKAEFNNISGVKTGADVQIAGVTVGKVRQLDLSKENQAMVGMQINREVAIPVDSVASVKSQGIIGDKYIQITLGGDETLYKPGRNHR